MQRAESPDEIDGMDTDDFAIGKKLGEYVQRDAVLGIMECGHEDESVGDIEVGITGRQALAAKYNRAWQWQFDNA